MTDWEDYLSSIYFNPKHPASFAGPSKLYQELKKDGRFSVGLRKIKQWVQNQDVYSIHRPLRRKFLRNKVIVSGIDEQWDVDLMDMSNLAKHNNGVKYLLLAIDIFSRFVFVQPLKTKTTSEVVKAFKNILKEGRKPKLVRSDKGSEFTGSVIEKYFKQTGIHHFVTQNEGKANYAERAIKTIKNSIHRYISHTQKQVYIDKLQDFIHSYNHSFHSSICMSPSEVNESNERGLWWYIYWPQNKVKKIKKQSSVPISKTRFKFKVDDLVRISGLKGPFTREVHQKWSSEIFKVNHRSRRDGIPIYKLIDFLGEDIKGSFYQSELQKVSISEDKLWKIEKILKTKKRKGKETEYFVRWLNWPKKFDSWVKASDIESI